MGRGRKKTNLMKERLYMLSKAQLENSKGRLNFSEIKKLVKTQWVVTETIDQWFSDLLPGGYTILPADHDYRLKSLVIKEPEKVLRGMAKKLGKEEEAEEYLSALKDRVEERKEEIDKDELALFILEEVEKEKKIHLRKLILDIMSNFKGHNIQMSLIKQAIEEELAGDIVEVNGMVYLKGEEEEEESKSEETKAEIKEQEAIPEREEKTYFRVTLRVNMGKEEIAVFRNAVILDELSERDLIISAEFESIKEVSKIYRTFRGTEKILDLDINNKVRARIEKENELIATIED